MQKPQQIYGIRTVLEAIASQEPIDKVFVQKGLQGDLVKQLENALRKHGITHAYVPVEKLDRLSKHNHQGVVANISPISFLKMEELVEQVLAKKEAPLFLLLDQLSDVRNFGAIIRTAECTGVDGIIVPKSGSAPVTADTVKTSAGAVFHMPIAKVDHIKDALFYLQASNFQVVAATEKTEDSIYDVDFCPATAIVMGSEDKGISPSVLKLVNKSAKLPLLGTIGSLNVSVACGVFLYEALRQRTAN